MGAQERGAVVVKHLIDEREPITLDDIDRALDDGKAYLENETIPGGETRDLIARLHAIVADTYGIVTD